MEDVLDIYQRPYDERFPVVCMDESSKQLLKEVRKPLPVEPGKPERYDTEYERNGTCNIFMFFEPLRGQRQVRVTDQRTAIDWAKQIENLIDIHYPDAEQITLVMDNLNTHAGASLYKAFAPAKARRLLNKLDLRYTPKHGSWLNMAEIELSILSRQCLKARLSDKHTMTAQVDAWQRERNQRAQPMNWQFTTDDARIKLRKLYPTF